MSILFNSLKKPSHQSRATISLWRDNFRDKKETVPARLSAWERFR
jgi:hypothetical protein